MRLNDLFTAPQVAKICSTDLKTIHNWVNRGEITFFRTPGRHLRFRREDIHEFLIKFGYPVPEGFTSGRPKVVVIDSSEATAVSIQTNLSEDMDVSTFPCHFDALLSIGKERPAVVLVNGDSGPDMMRLVKKISKNEFGLPIAVFGSGDSLREASKDAGASEYISNTDTNVIRDAVVSLIKTAV